MSNEEELHDRRWRLLRGGLNESYLKSSYEFLRSRDFDPILIKGWAIGREYPEPFDRVWSDFDFCLPAGEYERCLRLLTDETPVGGNIDLHRELRHLDTVPWDVLFDRSEFVKLGDTDIRILCPEDHLRVLCVHWLTDGGAYREKLWDVYHLVENHRHDFDWDKCLGSVSKTRREWVIRTIAAARLYLGLETAGLPFADETGTVPVWMRKALEKEWADDTRLSPIHLRLTDVKVLWKQVRKRIPPNPIQATIEAEGRLDESSRIPYQFKSMISRLGPSIRRVVNTLRLERREQR